MSKVSVCSKITFMGLMLALSSGGNAKDEPELFDSFDYFASSEGAKFSSHSALQVKACHALSDPITVRLVVNDVDTLQDTINLKINGSPVDRFISPFKDGADFSIPFKVNVSGDTEQVVMNKTARPYNNADITCYSKDNPSNTVKKNGTLQFLNGVDYTYGLSPIRGFVSATSVPDTKQDKECRDKVNKLGFAEIYHFDPYEPLDKADPVVQKNLKLGEAAAVEFLTGPRAFWFVTDTTRPLDANPALTNQVGDVVKNLYNDSNLVDVNTTVDNRYPHLMDASWSKVKGAIKYDITQRNINNIELTISERTGGIWFLHAAVKVSKFKWTRLNPDDEKTRNVLRLTLDGNAGVITSQSGLLSFPEDKYSENNFYETKSGMGISRGTLVPATKLNDAYDKYVKNTQNYPLSLPAVNDGDINLVNTEEIVIFVSKDHDSDKYSALVYGQPLQFSDILSGKRLLAPAGAVRNTCY